MPSVAEGVGEAEEGAEETDQRADELGAKAHVEPHAICFSMHPPMTRTEVTTSACTFHAMA
jgi:hypothetical protein